MAVKPSDINFYLTHVDHDQPQASVGLSTGGYQSTTEAHPHSLLTATVSVVGTTFPVVSTGVFLQPLVQVGEEVVSLDSMTGTLSVASGGRASFGTASRSHYAGDVAYALRSNDMFDGRFDGDLFQYRCIAVRNMHSSMSAKNVKFYLKQASRNPDCAVGIAVEQARTPYVGTTTATDGTTISVTAASLPAAFDDNVFDGCVLHVSGGNNVGLSRVVVSYDKATRTLVVDTAFPYSATAGDTFTVSPSPAQRVHSPLTAPASGSGLVSAFATPTTASAAIGVNVNGLRVNGDDLYPGDLAYVWMRRSLTRNRPRFGNNRIVLAIQFGT